MLLMLIGSFSREADYSRFFLLLTVVRFLRGNTKIAQEKTGYNTSMAFPGDSSFYMHNLQGRYPFIFSIIGG
jgi:hypothetical protein